MSISAGKRPSPTVNPTHLTDNPLRWPGAMTALLAELGARRLKLALVASGPHAAACAERFRNALQTIQVGVISTQGEQVDVGAPLAAEGDGALFLTGLDVLCWPDAGVDIVSWLCTAAGDRPIVAEWPGSISGGRLIYSEPGRPDHVDRALPDALVLRPVEAFFDDAPFTIERTR